MQIQTYGNKCYTAKSVFKTEDTKTCMAKCNNCHVKPVVSKPPVIAKPIERKKPERVNLKFGKIRVTVANSEGVRVSQEGDTMIIRLDAN